RYGIFLLLFVSSTIALSNARAAEQLTPPDWVLDKGVCTVSGFKVKDYPQWQVCQLDRGGEWRVFAGMKNFLIYVNDPDKYIGTKVRHSGDILVRDYTTKKWIDALFAYFVFGDDIIGPNGRDVAAFDSKEKAERFARSNKGLGVVRMLGLRRSVLSYLEGVQPDSADLDSIIVPKVIESKQAPVR
ncbi:MAG: nitrous oxide reductase accessory protein NosL, partial [bacterium]|nr:nitrous oxide reductase accessory protein NosL [bacterium]